MSAWAFDARAGWSQIDAEAAAVLSSTGFEQIQSTALDDCFRPYPCRIAIYRHKSVGQRRFTTDRSVLYQYLVCDLANSENIYVTNYPSMVELMPKFGLTVFAL